MAFLKSQLILASMLLQDAKALHSCTFLPNMPKLPWNLIQTAVVVGEIKIMLKNAKISNCTLLTKWYKNEGKKNREAAVKNNISWILCYWRSFWSLEYLRFLKFLLETFSLGESIKADHDPPLSDFMYYGLAVWLHNLVTNIDKTHTVRYAWKWNLDVVLTH